MKININNHVFLLIEKKYSDIESTISNIFCSFINDENSKIKIKNKTYYDFVEIDSNEYDVKQKISDMKKLFENQSIEKSGFKFYVIRNVESLSKSSINTLLKFIEDPPKKTIGIFTTRNINMVIETIRSRCEEITVNSDYDFFEKYIVDNNLSEYKKIYFEGFYNISDIESMDEKQIESIISFNKYFTSNFTYNNMLLEKLKEFKKLQYREIENIINSIKCMFDTNKYCEFLRLIDSVKSNLNKTLIFYSIIKIIKEG